MKLTSEELGELQYYLEEMRPDTVLSFRKENSEILEFNEHNLLMYKAKVNVVVQPTKENEQPVVEKKVVYFLETTTMEVRKSTKYPDICLAAIIFLAAEDIRMGFDLVRQDFLSTHPEHEGSRTLQ